MVAFFVFGYWIDAFIIIYMKEFALLQDKTSKMYYIGLASAIKSHENLEVIDKYTDEREAMEDLVAYSTGQKKGEVGARLTLKDVAEELKDE